MRRLIFISLLTAASVAAHAQVWEKLLAPGLTYRMEIDPAGPKFIYSLRWDIRSTATKAVPELGGGKVFENDPTKGRETLASMVKRTGAVAGINADFFPFTGDPIGLMVRSGELISQPYPTRSIFGWGDGTTSFRQASIKASFRGEGGDEFAIHDINADCKENSITLDTEATGIELAHTPNIAAVLKLEKSLSPQGKTSATVQYLLDDAEKVVVQPGTAILVGAGTKATAVATLRPGQRVTITTAVTGFDWSKVSNAVGGGPFLLKGGVPSVDAVAQRFTKDFYQNRHARSAVGKTADGAVIFTVVEARPGITVGATLDELADIMKRLGCTDAMNMDGGGSSSINIQGLTLNHPSENGERAIANGVLFFGRPVDGEAGPLTIKPPASLKPGTTGVATVQRQDGSAVPTSQVIWAVDGPAWIDQGGVIHCVGAGTATLRALVHGNIVTQTITIST